MPAFRVTHLGRKRGLLAVLVIIVSAGLVHSVNARGRQRADGGDRSLPGAAIFQTYCASCHGADGRGNGTLARTLRHAPSHLTPLSKGNGGAFPGDRVRRIVDGREIESHGDRDMPVWGDAFRTTREGRSAEAVATRIAALVDYLESVQQRDAE